MTLISVGIEVEKMRQPKDIIIGCYILDEILESHDRWTRKCKSHAMCADLHDADLHNSDLRYVNLRGANLHGANLSYAYLCNADLYNANLSDAYLCNANLYGADLIGADLSNANLSNANLCRANLRDAKGRFIEYRKGKILTQNIIGYKKCTGDHGSVIVTLEIPRGAIVFSINGYKFRTNKAKVIGLDGGNRAMSVYQYQYMSYYMGDEFTIYDFDCEYNVVCGPGIHFFMTREEAENYEF